MATASELSPGERNKLLGVLGRLSSPFDGERAAAGLLATRLLEGRDLTWSDVIGTPALPTPSDSQRPTSPPPRPTGTDLELANLLNFVRRNSARLNEKEAAFIGQVSNWRGPVSDRQRKWLGDIAARLRAGTR